MGAQPRLHRRAEAGVDLRVPLLVNLSSQSAKDALRLGLVGGRLPEAQLAPGERVDARVHDDLERGAAPADHPAGTALGSGLGHPYRSLDATVAAIDQINGQRLSYLRWSDRWRRGESNP
jgi:hypothetical protein